MRTFLITVCLIAFCGSVQAQGVRFERSYPWGRIRLSAASSEPVRNGGTRLFRFHKDVLVDLRYADGSHILLAAGRIEVNFANGDMTATEWPFLHCYSPAGNEFRGAALNDEFSVRFHRETIETVGTLKLVLPLPPIVQTRERQLAMLEKGW